MYLAWRRVGESATKICVKVKVTFEASPFFHL